MGRGHPLDRRARGADALSAAGGTGRGRAACPRAGQSLWGSHSAITWRVYRRCDGEEEAAGRGPGRPGLCGGSRAWLLRRVGRSPLACGVFANRRRPPWWVFQRETSHEALQRQACCSPLCTALPGGPGLGSPLRACGGRRGPQGTPACGAAASPALLPRPRRGRGRSPLSCPPLPLSSHRRGRVPVPAAALSGSTWRGGVDAGPQRLRRPRWFPGRDANPAPPHPEPRGPLGHRTLWPGRGHRDALPALPLSLLGVPPVLEHRDQRGSCPGHSWRPFS